MAKSDRFSEDMSATVAQSAEQARGAMENYINFFQKGMSASLWAGTDLSKKIQGYAEQNVANATGFAQKLTHAKDLQDLVRIQTEFMQTQLQTLSQQAMDLGTTATKTATDAFKSPLGLSS
jgi:hypothetical protein